MRQLPLTTTSLTALPNPTALQYMVYLLWTTPCNTRFLESHWMHLDPRLVLKLKKEGTRRREATIVSAILHAFCPVEAEEPVKKQERGTLRWIWWKRRLAK